ncbi:serine transporter [Vibrio maritimus]|uniref:Serine transporter n=1 Tax=Vibrio maritimus TaxID=990268 RepID=A0A090S6W6_9VIBR|nr:serine transporter [Vibrio maritimus]
MTTTTSAAASRSSSKWTYKDFTWALSLFGTAVGAGVLFLPIKAGAGGFWPLVILALIAAPMTWFAHKSLARFVLSAKTQMQISRTLLKNILVKRVQTLLPSLTFSLFIQLFLSTV